MANEPEMIRQQMVGTRTALSNKLAMLQNRAVTAAEGASTALVETVETIQESVEQTVRAVRGLAQGTLETVKDACDLPRHVERRPWTMVAGAAALGFLGGRLWHTSGREAKTAVGGAREPSWLSALGETFQPELAQLKGLAVGTVLGVVRDLVTQAVPAPMERNVCDAIDGITVKLGGQPLRGRVWPEVLAGDRAGAPGNRAAGGRS